MQGNDPNRPKQELNLLLLWKQLYSQPAENKQAQLDLKRLAAQYASLMDTKEYLTMMGMKRNSRNIT